MHTLKAMQIDMFVIRHKQSGLPHHVAEMSPTIATDSSLKLCLC
jgi:aspartate carbamoyltransferase catalytic subunit